MLSALEHKFNQKTDNNGLMKAKSLEMPALTETIEREDGWPRKLGTLPGIYTNQVSEFQLLE